MTALPWRLARGNRVVPLAMELVHPQGYRGYLRVRNRDAFRIGPGVTLCVNLEALPSSGRGDQLDDDFVARQGTAAPVHADVREEAVLDLVPFASSRG